MNRTCTDCGEGKTRVYPVNGGSLRYLCISCGLKSVPESVADSYIVVMQGVRICLSGEQLTNPSWHCSQVLSTSHASHHAMRSIMECSSGMTLRRDLVGNAMGLTTTRCVSYDGTVNETFYACPVMVLAVLSVGTHTVLVSCPRPSVASSTLTLLQGSAGLIGADEEWRNVTGSSEASPMSARHTNHVVGRNAETMVSMNMSRTITDSAYVSSTTFMTKITFVLDSRTIYGMTRESLRTLGDHMRSTIVPHEWSMVLQEAYKMTMRSTMGPTVVLTYTGTISCMGSPSTSPVVLGRFFRALELSFRKDTSMRAIKESRKVRKATWSVAIGSIY